MEKSNGQVLVERMEAFITRYVALPGDPAGQSLVMALWALHTFVYKRFGSTPYLNITASVMRAGKSMCAEVLGLICQNAIMFSTLRPLALVRVIGAFDGNVTLLLDEAEKLSQGALGDLRSIFTTGYRRGGTHAISSGKTFTTFPTFAPKVLITIGDVMPVVRDRSIVIHLQRATPQVDFFAHRAEAESEAEAIQADVVRFYKSIPEAVGLPMVSPTFLDGREREIWTAIYSVAAACKLDAATMHKLEAATTDLVGMKSFEARTHSSKQDEEKVADAAAGEKALADLRSVLAAGERAIFSAEAVNRLRELPTGQWRKFKGPDGLSQNMLTALLRPFGLRTSTVRVGKGRKGSVTGMGWYVADIKKAALTGGNAVEGANVEAAPAVVVEAGRGVD